MMHAEHTFAAPVVAAHRSAARVRACDPKTLVVRSSRRSAARVVARSWPLAALAVVAALFPACGQDASDTLHAFRATSRHQLVGGPVAYADVGDFVLENDKVRVAILDSGRSWGPGVFGGSLVDADVRRGDGGLPTGQGHDRLAEVFPFANLDRKSVV